MPNANYIPSESQIRQACSRIRSEWEPEVRQFRCRVTDARMKTLAQRIFRGRNAAARRLTVV